MPTTTEKQYILGIKVTGGTASDVYVNIRNQRTGDYYKVQTSSNEAAVNLRKLTDNGDPKSGTHTDFTNGDIIEITVSGLRAGGTTHTVNRTKGGGRVSVTLTDVSTSNAPAISI
ncbi:MAG: hypothetical protein CL811_06310 [Colwelliaceae bacterium]|jgi:hypothetical protein|nr:hypothetical protein [Colwelliaceae bacterium]|tara:strand:+ start:9706 stop:10050 length:345 start_codon:yes stop_codon:yes gene_type:complete